jgi:hypothetical protein
MARIINYLVAVVKDQRHVLGRSAVFTAAVAIIAVTATAGGTGEGKKPEPQRGNGKCGKISGTMMTNIGAIDESHTLGIVTGDLTGGLSATIVELTPSYSVVTHNIVTEAGDSLRAQPARINLGLPNAAGQALAYGEVTFAGGTGKYADATGQFKVFGSVDLTLSHTVFRYSGEICAGK